MVTSDGRIIPLFEKDFLILKWYLTESSYFWSLRNKMENTDIIVPLEHNSLFYKPFNRTRRVRRNGRGERRAVKN